MPKKKSTFTITLLGSDRILGFRCGYLLIVWHQYHECHARLSKERTREIGLLKALRASEGHPHAVCHRGSSYLYMVGGC